MQYFIRHRPISQKWEIFEQDTSHPTNIVGRLGNVYYVYIDHVFDPLSDVALALTKAEQLIAKFITEDR